MELVADFPRPRRKGSSPPPRQTQPRRVVRFEQTIEVEFIENLSVGHRAGLFYSQRDIASFRAQIARQVRVLQKIKASFASSSDFARMMSEVEDTSSFLGLESLLTDASYWEIFRRRGAHTAAVLREQRRHIGLGLCDLGALASVSREGSRRSRRRARIIALLHAANAN